MESHVSGHFKSQVLVHARLCTLHIEFDFVFYIAIICFIGIPGPPQNPSVRFDDSTEMLTINITWQPPPNSGQFDLEVYTVNVTSTSGIDTSVQVPAGTTTHQFTDNRNATFNVTIAATNRCGQTGAPASLMQQEFVPSKTICYVSMCICCCWLWKHQIL